MIEEEMLKYLRHLGIEPRVNPHKYKLKFHKIIKDQETGEEDFLLICMRIFRKGDQKFAVEFIRLSGIEMNFYNEFIYYRDNVLSFANDIIN